MSGDGDEGRQRFDEQVLTDAIYELWQAVADAVIKLVQANQKFGFTAIQANLNPSLADIVFALTVSESLLSAMVDSRGLDHDQLRMALNSKQSILLIRRLNEALQSKDEAEYNQVMKDLGNQSTF